MATKWHQLSKRQQAYARQLADKLHAAGVEISVTKVGGDLDASEDMLAAAERAAARKAAEETAAQPQTTEAPEAQDAAQLIATIRSAGVSVREIAQTLGVAASTVYRWAKRNFRPVAPRLALLAVMAGA